MSGQGGAPGWGVCFQGARDNYEAAVALAEVGALDCLLTDVYLDRTWMRRLLARRVHAPAPRHHPGLPADRVRTAPAAFLADRLRAGPLAGLAPKSGATILEERFAALAGRASWHLLSYANYARAAFLAAGQGRRKVLFQFHPQRVHEMAGLRRHLAAWPTLAREAEAPGDDRNQKNIDEINAADAIVCASSFTRASVEHVLARETPVVVAPYGPTFTLPGEEMLRRRRPGAPFTAIFVGAGTARKGLHLLLAAWREVARPDHRLIIVTRSVSPGVAELLGQAPPNVTVLSGLTGDELATRYAAAHAFVFPSLCEGFGHVIPEAMGMGCYPIASDATCLADIDLPAGTGEVVPAGDADALSAALARAVELHRRGALDPLRIHAAASVFRWDLFRGRVREACGLNWPKGCPPTP